MLYLLAIVIVVMMMVISERVVESERATLSMALHSWKPWVAIGSLEGLVRLYDHFLNFAALATNRVFEIGPVRALCFVPDSRCLVAGGGVYGQMSILHERTLQILRTINAHSDSILDLQRYGSYLVSTSDDDTLRFWRRIGPLPALARTLPANGVCSLALHAPSSTILIGCSDGTLSVWSEMGGDWEQFPEWHTGPVQAIELLADDTDEIQPRSVATVGRCDHMLRIWDMEEHICLRQFLAGSSRINFIVLWQESSLMVADSSAIRCWDMDSNSPLTEYSMPMTAMPVCAEPDGDRLLLGTSDGMEVLYYQWAPSDCSDDNLVLGSDGGILLDG